MRIQDNAADALSDLVENAPIGGNFTPTFSDYSNLLPQQTQIINVNYVTNGPMVTVTGLLYLGTEATTGLYSFIMTTPFPINATYDRINGSINAYTNLYNGELFFGPVVKFTSNTVQATLLTSDPSAATSRQLTAQFSYSFFVESADPLVQFLDLPLA
jgi:hypothetical protein